MADSDDLMKLNLDRKQEVCNNRSTLDDPTNICKEAIQFNWIQNGPGENS